MVKVSLNIKIEHEKFGTILDESFVDSTQFKLFLKMVHGCVELKNDLTFFDGNTFFVHIPIKHLSESIIVTSFGETFEVADHVRSKIEAKVTK
jgi:hypothetical protein